MADTSRDYKIVLRDAERKTLTQRVQELRGYLAANIDVATADGDLSKAALFQQHLDTLLDTIRAVGPNLGAYRQAQELRDYLAANIAVAIVDGNLSKAALFQQRLDTLDTLVERSRDRID